MRMVAISLALALTFAALIYSIWIERYWIEVTRHHVLARLTTPVKIAHLSDLHTYGIGRLERKMLAIMEEEKPDIILITGDWIGHGAKYDMCHEVFQSLHAPLGVWFVRGNYEALRPARNERSFYESAGVNFLLNSNKQVTGSIWIIGFDDAMIGNPDLDTALAGVPAEAFKIALFHSPAYFDEAAGRCNLALAGHTHGGQVRVPLVKPFWLPAQSGRFLEGWFEQDGSRMYVSRGLGTSLLGLRFLCRPEIAIITVGQ